MQSAVVRFSFNLGLNDDVSPFMEGQNMILMKEICMIYYTQGSASQGATLPLRNSTSTEMLPTGRPAMVGGFTFSD